MSVRRSIAATVFVFALTVSPVAHADTTPSRNDPFTDAIQFWSTIVTSIDSLAHELATAFIPHQSQLTDRGNANGSNNLNPPAVAEQTDRATYDLCTRARPPHRHQLVRHQMRVVQRARILRVLSPRASVPQQRRAPHRLTATGHEQARPAMLGRGRAVTMRFNCT
jgi:hypothetical protein